MTTLPKDWERVPGLENEMEQTVFRFTNYAAWLVEIRPSNHSTTMYTVELRFENGHEKETAKLEKYGDYQSAIEGANTMMEMMIVLDVGYDMLLAGDTEIDNFERVFGHEQPGVAESS